MRDPGRILVVSCYELGHQPVAVATAVAFLKRAGFAPEGLDLSVEPIPSAARLQQAGLIAISVPMHTALRTAVAITRKIRPLAPRTHFCFFGHYALLNEKHLLDGIADSVLGGESEASLVELAARLESSRSIDGIDGLGHGRTSGRPVLDKLAFPIPDRSGLPPLERYAALEAGGIRRIAAAVESTRGCLQTCRHCPIVPVYGGRFFAVPRDVVLADIESTVGAGATHITFADPDFLNGPGHSLAIVREMNERFPGITFDATTKIELILRHPPVVEELAERGCLFFVSAVESLSNQVLHHLNKGHTREDVFRATRLVRGTGSTLRPSLLPFTPWASLQDLRDLLDWVETDGLIDAVDPVQYAVRLLLPPGSPLIDLPAMQPHLGSVDPANFSYSWVHPDPRMDRLQLEIGKRVTRAALAEEDDFSTFLGVRTLLDEIAGEPGTPRVRVHPAARERSRPPRLTEPWFC